MKKIGILTAVFLLGIAARAQIHSPTAQDLSQNVLWENVGPAGGSIQALASNSDEPSEIFALSVSDPIDPISQVYKSSDAGQTWNRIAVLSGRFSDIALASHMPRRIYLLGATGLVKSEDGGSTWREFLFGSNCFSASGKIAVHPANSAVLYASGNVYDSKDNKTHMTVFRSSDGGETWAPRKIVAGSQATAYGVAVPAINPLIVYASGYYYDGSKTRYKIYKSLDEGNTWNDISGVIEVKTNQIVADQTNPLKVFAGTSLGTFRSSDGGQTWQFNSQIYSTALTIDGANPKILYSGYDAKCYKSEDGGSTWRDLSGSFSGICTAMFAFSSHIYYGSPAGLAVSRDSGASWEPGQTGMNAAVITALSICRSNPNILTAKVEGGGFFKSQDYGNTWARIPDIPGCTSSTTIKRVAIHPFNAQVIYAILSNSIQGGG